jgi:hypothetical protein
MNIFAVEYIGDVLGLGIRFFSCRLGANLVMVMVERVELSVGMGRGWCLVMPLAPVKYGRAYFGDYMETSLGP